MKIKKLEVVGFKSFVDRTAIHFNHDVTGIVGPNGCGKSNVVDAIKWVMGEQAPKMLRGSSMNDVIFNGSEARGPAQFAEVSLTFDNTAGLAPPEYRDYAEITVSRRLDRQGRSDYFINRTPVRLLDVTNLFLGTGVGRRAYSIIEQGRIGFIVTSKPEDRRAMIEEAAGVTKFKAHKKAAERKMDATRLNLTRVDDILREIEKNLASLKRQAQKAERYREYREELRELDLHVGTFRYLEAFTALRYVEKQLATDEASAEGLRIGLAVRDAETAVERLAAEQASREVARAQGVSYGLDNEVKLLESRIRQHKERFVASAEREGTVTRELAVLGDREKMLSTEREQLELVLAGVADAEAAANEQLEIELEALEERRRHVDEAARVVAAARARASDAQRAMVGAETKVEALQRRRDDLAGRLGRKRAERETLGSELVVLEQERRELSSRYEGIVEQRRVSQERRTVCESQLATLRDELATLAAEADGLRDVVSAKRSRHTSLRELDQKLEGVGGGTRALVRRFQADAAARERSGFVGLVADRIECAEDVQAALAGALGDRLEALVVEQPDQARDALAWLRGESAGRASVVARAGLADATLVEIPRQAGVVGRLVEELRFAEADAAFVRRLLGDVVLVDSIEVAFEAAAVAPRATFVSRDGDVLRSDGTLAGGQADDAAAHRLAMKRELRALEADLEVEGVRYDDAVRARDERRVLVTEREVDLEAARVEAHAAELDLLGVEKDVRRVESELDRLRGRVEDSQSEIEDLAFEVSEIEEQESLLREQLDVARESDTRVAEEVIAAAEVQTQHQIEVERQNARVTDVRIRLTQVRERASGDRKAVERVETAEREARERHAELTRELRSLAEAQGRVKGELFRDAESLAQTVESAMNASEVLKAITRLYEEARDAAAQSDAELRQIRTRVDALGLSIQKLTVRRSELNMTLERVVEHVATRHSGHDVRRTMQAYHDRETPDAATIQRIGELDRLIERMGPINLEAIEEYDRENARFVELAAQRKDLLDALAQLERAIRQMNRESRALFKEAFESIDATFRLVFPQLFRGGEAKLVLSNPDDLLESGVDIVAQPPGKKLGSLDLMSGGEKALTAVALVFAIFQFKPSPFCILDEVDAPLDEANIARFAEAVRQMTDRSQFIVITHSKRTMETTDVLYGVTMEQPGISKLVAVELRGRRRPVPEDRTVAA